MNEELELFANENDEAKTYLLGKVTSIFFAASDSFYKVVLLKVEENNFDWQEPEIVATGSFGDLQEEGVYKFFGKVIEHAKYGKQFQVTNYQSKGPNSENGLINYLSGENFSGIGKVTATKIVDLLGLDAINKILDDPNVLKELGLKSSLVDNLVMQLNLNDGMEQVIIGLNEFGFGATLASAIFQKYQTKALEIIRENPYQLIFDIEGVGFKKADQIANILNISFDSSIRIKAAIIAILEKQSYNSGNTYSQVDDVLHDAYRLLTAGKLELDISKIQNELLILANEKKIVADGDNIYLANLYSAEWKSAETIVRLAKQKKLITYSNDKILDTVSKVEKQFKIKYDDLQKKAIADAINSPVFILTGGPGTGKTTIVNGLVATFALLHEIDLDVNAYKEDDFPILLAAPTGRAAKRMSETTGLPAKTIHRLLGLTGRQKNEEPTNDMLKGKLLIVDEMSMVDMLLFNTLMSSIGPKMQIIFVGDKDQLPSVGPGQVFADLLNSNNINYVELNKIYRQANESSIIPLAHAIKDGNLPTNWTENKPDRTFIMANASQIPLAIEKVVKRASDKGFLFNEMQVLAPMYKGSAGINNLNQVMQEILNPLTDTKKREVVFNEQKFRVNDKVLHLVNSPESNIFNGDIGKIVEINLAGDKNNTAKVDQLTIQFDAGDVTYQRSQWNKITLAYATSIHKAQGSEFKLVIMPIVKQYSIMLKRNLIYTGLTRASQMLVLIGEPDAFEYGVHNLEDNRNTTLKQRIEMLVMDYKKNDTITNDNNSNTVIKNNDVKVDSKKSIDELIKENTILGLSDEAVDYQTKLSSKKDTILTMSLIENKQIDPMIGMEGILPTDFIEKNN